MKSVECFGVGGYVTLIFTSLQDVEVDGSGVGIGGEWKWTYLLALYYIGKRVRGAILN